MITYQYRINMTPGGIPVRCRLGQYDDDWSIVFTLFSASGEFTVESGTTAKIRGTKKDGLGYSANATINISNKTVTVAGDKQITAVAGENIFELVLYKGTKELSTANIVFFVEPAAMDAGTLVSDSQVQEILDMSADVIAASANVSTLRGNFAPAYSASAPYAIGDYCVRNNQLYRCITAIPTGEDWTSGHWVAISTSSEILGLIDDRKVQFPVKGASAFTWDVGHTITAQGAYSSNNSTAVTSIFPVSSGSAIRNMSNAVGMSSKSTVFFVCEYNGTTFVSRAQVAAGAYLTLGATTSNIRLIFGYAGSAGNTETQEDVNANFACQIIAEVALKLDSATKSELESVITNTPSISDSVNVSIIPNNTDFNSLTTPGTYKVSSSGNMQTMTNSPTVLPAKVIVFFMQVTTSIGQIVIPSGTTNSLFYRAYVGSAWHDWSQFAYKDYVDSQVQTVSAKFANYPELTTTNNTTLTSDSDIDTLSEGSYKVGSATVCNAVGLPLKSGGRLFVLTGNAANREVQIWIAAGKIAIRRNLGSSWSDWSILAPEASVVQSKNYVASSSSDLDDFNNAPINSIIAVNRLEVPNAPVGDGVMINDDSKPGTVRGTLITFSPQDTNQTYIVQTFYGYYTSVDVHPPIVASRIAGIKDGALAWSPWGYFAQDKYLRSTNIVIRASTASSWFTDLNDVPINTVYQIDKDCVEGVLDNHPAPGYSAVLITNAFAVTTRHGMVQTLYSLQSGVPVEYIRYGWLNSEDDYRWTAWRKVLTEAVT